MPKEIFVDAPITVGTRKWYTVPLSICAHMVGAAAILAAPLMVTGLLPSPASLVVFTMAAAVPPPPDVLPAKAPQPVQPTPTNTEPFNPDAAPLQAPHGISDEPPQTLSRAAGVTDGLPKALPNAGPSLGVAPPAPPPTPQRVVPGGDIKEPRKIVDVRPKYPQVAIAARVEGRVIIQAVISRDGHVIEVRVLRSEPLLDQAALEAVRQWKFTPTLLNGAPVEVEMTVTVNFALH